MIHAWNYWAVCVIRSRCWQNGRFGTAAGFFALVSGRNRGLVPRFLPTSAIWFPRPEETPGREKPARLPRVPNPEIRPRAGTKPRISPRKGTKPPRSATICSRWVPNRPSCSGIGEAGTWKGGRSRPVGITRYSRALKSSNFWWMAARFSARSFSRSAFFWARSFSRASLASCFCCSSACSTSSAISPASQRVMVHR